MVYANNKKSRFNYEILKKYEAGIELKGTEVKSIKMSNVSIKEAFIRIIKNEVFVFQMTVNNYDKGNINNVETDRPRKLLLNKKEIMYLLKEVRENRYAVVPISVYSKNRLIKLEIGLARGKKLYDKRETLKKRDIERSISKKYK